MTSKVVNKLETELDAFIEQWIAYQTNNDVPLLVEQDEEWPSPALVGNKLTDGTEFWQPTKQQNENSLSALEKGLHITVDKELETYFTSYWSDNLNASTERGKLQLLIPWNEQDFVRLQENLIAHVLMKRRLGQRDTLFFAVTDEEDFILSVINDTGEVALEQVGREPQEILAPSLTEFIQQLSPVIADE